MTTQYTSTAHSITEVLLAGDAILNLSDQPLNTAQGTRFVSARGETLSCGRMPASVVWKHAFAPSASGLLSAEVTRLVVVSDENSSTAVDVTRDLTAHGIPHILCMLMASCDADMFMDEEDTGAVTERLRQLGYL